MKFQITILFIFYGFILFSQPKQINVDGKIFGEEEEPLKNVLIEIFQEDSLFEKYRTENKGEYHFKLPYDHDYVLVFSKNKYYQKIVNIKAGGIKREDVSFAQKFGDWEVYLFKEVAGVDASILDEAVGEIYFNEVSGFFDWDASYFELIKDDLSNFEMELKEKREEALQNRIENYSSGFEALKERAKPIEDLIPKQDKKTISNYDALLVNAYNAIPKIVKENFEQKNRYYIITREVIIEGVNPVIFRKVVHEWGGKYYFRNGVNITGLQFELLTATEYDFAPSFDEEK